MLTYWGFNNNYGSTGTLIAILIWVLIAVAVVEIIRAIFSSSSRHHHTPPTPPAQPMQPTTVVPTFMPPVAKSPLEILNERYAKGEINKDEFDQKKADILSHTQ